MRAVVVWLGMAAVCFVSASARAQAPAFTPAPPNAGASRNAPGHLVQPGAEGKIRRQVSESDQIIYERAVAKAHQRDVRMESRKWAGVHPQRPDVRHGHYSNDLNRYIWSPVYGYYAYGSYYSPVPW